MYEELRADGTRRLVEGVGVGSGFDRLRNWDSPSKTQANKEVDNKFAADMWEVLDSAGNLLLSKHHDYGPKNIAGSPGGPINGLRVRMWDKIARINNLVDNNKNPNNESLRDSFLDLLNYSAIALMVLDNNWPETPTLDCE
jgi:hypothetical protein